MFQVGDIELGCNSGSAQVSAFFTGGPGSLAVILDAPSKALLVFPSSAAGPSVRANALHIKTIPNKTNDGFRVFISCLPGANRRACFIHRRA
jgi:hypothetical protein